jgi:MYXO-CTERM domain-containing protein
LISFWSDGAFAPPEFGRIQGFVGFRFNTGKGTQYGWARVQTGSGNNHRLHDVIKDYAWADVGEDIRTGQTSSSGDMVHTVTDSGSVGLLALGAAGLVTWRKRRKQATE